MCSMQMDASIRKGVLVNWGFSWFPSEESLQPNGASYIYKHESMEGKKSRGICEDFVISPLYFSSDFHLAFPKYWNQHICCMHGQQAMQYSFNLVFIQLGVLEGRQHMRSDTSVMALFAIPWAGVKIWVTSTMDSGRSKEMALHLIERSVFKIHHGLKRCAFVYRQASTRRCQRYKRFIEAIYRTFTWPSQSI